MEILYFLWQMVQQNCQAETTNSKNPLLRREYTPRERISAENRIDLSGESHGDREEFRLEESEDDAEARE